MSIKVKNTRPKGNGIGEKLLIITQRAYFTDGPGYPIAAFKTKIAAKTWMRHVKKVPRRTSEEKGRDEMVWCDDDNQLYYECDCNDRIELVI